jgi:hypothetical protein
MFTKALYWLARRHLMSWHRGAHAQTRCRRRLSRSGERTVIVLAVPGSELHPGWSYLPLAEPVSGPGEGFVTTGYWFRG